MSLAVRFVNAALGSGRDLRAWLEAEGALDADESLAVSLRLQEFVALQVAVRDLLVASIGGGPFPSAAVERVNRASERVPRVLLLGVDGPSATPVAAGPAALTLARIAWSAIELLGGPDRQRLRRCGSCGRFFLSTRSDRVWCSNACGNRMRVARHHARRRTHT